MNTTYEVELKFPVADGEQLRQRLQEIGASLVEEHRQADAYFNHPCKDFAQTDEALRLRTDNGVHRITYKGPKIDAGTKTRREIELQLGDTSEAFEQWQQLLTSLGFRPTATVTKTRQVWQLAIDRAAVEIALDQVEHVGEFIEFELASDEEGLDEARQTLWTLAHELGLTESERRSYLELLLERQG